MNTTNINSPTLLLNKEQVLKNIQTMAEKAKKHHLIFRPHFKTHQSAEIGNWFKDVGVDKITVSSVGMANYFAHAGWKDITIAFPLNVRELNDIENLAKKIKLNVLINSLETMQYMVKNGTQNIGYFIKIDTGYHRAGILAENVEQIQQIIETAEQNKNLYFKGFLAHFGHTYHANNQSDILKIFETGRTKLANLKEHFIHQYPNMLISIGDTPSCTLANNFSGIDEIRPGNLVFFDLMQSSIGVCHEKDIAVAVVCPVVDKYPERGEVIIYGGAVHFSKEYIFNKQRNKIFGKIAQLSQNGWTEMETKIYLSSLSQEHGVIKAPKSFINSLKIGDLLAVLPVHSCLTANLLKEYLLLDGEKIKMWRNC